MNGPEHYRRAEALLDSCQLGVPTPDEDGRALECYGTSEDLEDTRAALMAAQIHATLALAAAEVSTGATAGGVALPVNWAEVVS